MFGRTTHPHEVRGLATDKLANLAWQPGGTRPVTEDDDAVLVAPDRMRSLQVSHARPDQP